MLCSCFFYNLVRHRSIPTQRILRGSVLWSALRVGFMVELLRDTTQARGRQEILSSRFSLYVIRELRQILCLIRDSEREGMGCRPAGSGGIWYRCSSWRSQACPLSHTTLTPLAHPRDAFECATDIFCIDRFHHLGCIDLGGSQQGEGSEHAMRRAVNHMCYGYQARSNMATQSQFVRGHAERKCQGSGFDRGGPKKTTDRYPVSFLFCGLSMLCGTLDTERVCCYCRCCR